MEEAEAPSTEGTTMVETASIGAAVVADVMAGDSATASAAEVMGASAVGCVSGSGMGKGMMVAVSMTGAALLIAAAESAGGSVAVGGALVWGRSAVTGLLGLLAGISFEISSNSALLVSAGVGELCPSALLSPATGASWPSWVGCQEDCERSDRHVCHTIATS